MAYLLWIRGLTGPSPQVVFDGPGDQPFIDEGIRSSVLSQHKLKDEEATLSLNELSSRYPAPAYQEA